MAADHRSIVPTLAGLPAWAAVALAAVATAIGLAFDAGSGGKELTLVFSALYVMGCLAAVLMVQQSGLFTTVVQPPLILFVSVPFAYWLFHGAGFPGLKNAAINTGYPLIERFPLMLFTAAAVLVIGIVRWSLGMLDSTRSRVTKDPDAAQPQTLTSRLSALLGATFNRNPAHAIEQPAPRERTSGQRPRRATAESRRAAREGNAGRSGTRSTARRSAAGGSTPSRSRHVRPEMADSAGERPRRRPAPDQRDDRQPPRRRPASDLHDERAPRRRPAPDGQHERRARPRPPQDAPRAGDPSRMSRDPRVRNHRPEGADSLPRRRPAPAGAEGRPTKAGATRHPVSQVRYRKAPTEGPESQPRPRPRAPREEADSWEFDI